MLLILMFLSFVGVTVYLCTDAPLPGILRRKSMEVIGISSLAILLLSVAVLAIITLTKSENIVQTAEYQLTSINDDGQMMYHISIDDVDSYLFHYLNNDGDIINGAVSSKDVTINYVDTDNPYILEYTVYNKFIVSKKAQDILVFDSLSDIAGKKYEVFIPKGTIQEAHEPIK